MLWFGKLKEDAKQIFREHPASVITCFIGFFVLGVIDDILSKIGGLRVVRDALSYIADFCFSFAPALLLCESNYRYKKKIGRIESLKEIRKSIVYIVVLVIGALMSLQFSRIKNAPSSHVSWIFDIDAIGADNLFMRFFLVYIAVCVISAVFFLYKKSEETFESYFVKGFLGIMKGELAYGVVLLGGLCIVWVFQTLIYDIDAITIIVSLISGVMAYPAVLVALSRPGEKISKFGTVMMGYVFPGILAAAFLIVYVYIFKIVFTWKFPSNEAFAIITALFISGICFWSMAQGCTEGRYRLAMRIYPLLFIPFIVIQIICLHMRVSQYGLTESRYFGILLIIFEILYEIVYIVMLCLGKGMEWILFPMVLAFILVGLVIPGINVCASVTRSQGKVVEQYIEDVLAGKETASGQLSGAMSAYKVIDRDAGYEGAIFIEKLKKKFPEYDVENELSSGNSYEDTISKTEYYNANHNVESFDTNGHGRVGYVDVNIYGEVENIADISLHNMEAGESFGRVNISGLIQEMKKLNERKADSEEYDRLIEEPIRFGDGSELIITYIGFEDLDGVIRDLHINGFYLYD